MLKSKGFYSIVAAGLACLAATGVQAQSEVQLNIPYYFFDDQPLDDELGVGLGYGYRFDNPWGAELTYSEVEPDFSNGNSGLDLSHWQLNALYHFGESGKLDPFALIGIGNMEFDLDVGGSNDTLASALGFGAKYHIDDNWRLRGDARWFHTDEGSDNLYAFTLGVAYVFGQAKATPPAPAPAPKAAPAVRDSDDDGVNDQADRCPNTPRGVNVDASGCPLDGDNDGVADYQDDCPDTTARVRVDDSGCPVMLEETVSIDLEVNFDTNSAEIHKAYYPEIRRVAEFLEQYENTEAVIEGHSDARGDAGYNKELSQRRAGAVRDVLVQVLGVSSDRVRAVGYGEERLLREENSAEAHEANRRVVAEISTVIEQPATAP